jgi:hypothetical protein
LYLRAVPGGRFGVIQSSGVKWQAPFPGSIVPPIAHIERDYNEKEEIIDVPLESQVEKAVIGFGGHFAGT